MAMASQQYEENTRYELTLNVTLPSDTPVPVAGVEIAARTAGFRLAAHPHSFNFCWCWEKLITCSVHHEKLASVQCIDCVKLNIPKDQSYHCTAECFAAAWERHKNSHSNAAECKTTSTFGDQHKVNKLKRSSGSWPESLYEIAEQEGAEWVKVGSSIIYDPSNDGIRLPLRLESFAIDHAEGAHFSPVQSIVTDLVIFPPPSPRLMIGIGSNEKYLSSDGFVFSVLSYNILADMHTKGIQMRSYCPRWALFWEFRRQNLLNEIIEYDADIICLQEVQDNHFESFFKPELTKRGYSALYKKKTNEIFTAEGYVSEGCATFYRRNLFREIMIYELEFNRKAQVVQEALEPELQNDGVTRLRMHNVALIVVLQALTGGSADGDLQSRICVANTHVYSEKNRPDVRAFQVATLIHELEEITQSQIPMLICADLNSVPGSDPHTLLIRGEINSIEGNNPVRIERFIRLVHSLHLESAYASFPDNFEPPFTIFTQKFAGTLDYILYSADRLKVVGLLELPSKESLGEALPSPYWSSDHIALKASLRLLSQTASSLHEPPNVKDQLPNRRENSCLSLFCN